MKFKVENYKLEYYDDFPFELYSNAESPVLQIQKNKKGMVFGSEKKLQYAHKTKTKTLTKFANEISAIEANSDLCIAGDYNGNIKVVDYKKNLIQSTDDHTAKVNEIKIIDKTKYLSCSNDSTVKCFELATKKAVNTYRHHKDYVKCIEYCDNVIYSGGLDNTVIAYDTRSNSVVSTTPYTSFITKICTINDSELIVASKSQIYVYDKRNNQNIKSCYATTKNIIDVKVHNQIIYCATQDSWLKSYNKNLSKISQYKFEDKMQSFDLYKDGICVGCCNGNIYEYNSKASDTKAKKAEKHEVIERYYRDKKSNIKRIAAFSYKQCKIEKLINNNQHWLAFSELLNEESLQVIFASLSFIKEQNGIKKVLKDRKVTEINVLTGFIIDNFHIAEFRSVFLDILTILFAMYERLFQQNAELKEKLDFFTQLFEYEKDFEESAILFQSCYEAKTLE